VTAVLAMDIATKMGWALHKPGMPKPFFGTVQFVRTPEKVGEAMEQMREFLELQHRLHGGLTDIVFEAQHVASQKRKRKDPAEEAAIAQAIMRRVRSGGDLDLDQLRRMLGSGDDIATIDINVIRKLIALGGMAEWFAHCIGARCFQVHIGTWRKHFCGRGNLKRDQAKQMAVDTCRRLGIDPPDDNAAEACGILDYYLSIRRISGKPYPVPWRDIGLFQPLGSHG
jgi:hypothetical protein